MLVYVLAIVALLVSLLLTWAVGLIGALTGVALLLVRIVLVLLGVTIAALLISSRRKRQLSGGRTPESTALDDLVREAEQKLAASHRSGAKNLNSLPLLYVLGEANSAKTTVVLKSGLEPELLAGQIYRDKDVVPTPVANIWYSEKAAIIEVGESVRSSLLLWNRLIARTRPGAYRSAFGAGAPSRGAVVCVSCEQFLGAQSTESMQAAAAATGERLRQLARLLGTRVPTYVLLTKLDRVPAFNDFVRNLSNDEASQLLGAVPAHAGTSAGFYVEQATTAVSSAYDTLIFSLASARLDLLQREGDSARLGTVYEFPRNMRKFRNSLTTYLVELARPSHLDSNPYLRGFYFTGVRAQIREQVAVDNVQPSRRAAQADPGATTVFAFQQAAPVVQRPLASNITEKIAQWTFLSRFFPLTVLGDSDALSGTSKTNHAKLFRRMLYGTCAALLVIYLGLLTASYLNNAALERAIESASAALASSSSHREGLASVEQLNLLDGVRARLVQLEDYRQHGAPVMYRWGLYRGDLLLGPARRVYFNHFRELLLNRSQSNILSTLGALPSAPPQGADYNGTYAALRAFLITTTYPQRSTPDFLTPVLLKFWENGATTDSGDQHQLAQRQFDFYAGELARDNPYLIAPATATVSRTRGYLASFGGFERIYQTMVTAAGKAGPPIDFNRQNPHSAETVIEPHIVPAAFTKPGYAFMQDALSHPDHYFSGEAWVLGDQAPPSIELGSLKQKLATRYTADYLAHWRAFLKDAMVVRYRDLRDAGTKLSTLSGNSSPLLGLIYTVSHNTSVADPQISAAFQAPQAFVSGGSGEQYISASNKTYVDALLALDGTIVQVMQNPSGASDPTVAMPISSAAAAAHLAAQQNAQNFHIDSQAHTDAATLALMEAPIASAEGLVHGLGPIAVNSGGKSFCSAFSAVFAKVPFNPNASIQASPAEVSALLQPGTGSLWQFYNANLKSLLVQQGAEYVDAPNPPMQVNPAFTKFFNRSVNLSQALFPAGGGGPALTFVLRNVPGTGVQNTLVKVDAQSLSNTETSRQFSWSAQTSQTASLTANNLPLTFDGPWAIFQMFSKARAQKIGGGYELSFPLEVANTPVKAPDGTPVVARFELSGPGSDVLAPGAFASLHCVSAVAH